MALSIWQLLLVAMLFILMFGRGKIPALMSDLAIGIKNFKSGLKDDAAEPAEMVSRTGDSMKQMESVAAEQEKV
jgi:sec-independent protein translocase protein TatA